LVTEIWVFEPFDVVEMGWAASWRREGARGNWKLTTILRICRVQESFYVERRSKGIFQRLCNEILFSARN
jgi:hypothetical protein